MGERTPIKAALYAVDSLLGAMDEGRQVTSAELRLVRALVAAIPTDARGFRRAIEALRDEAKRLSTGLDYEANAIVAHHRLVAADFLESLSERTEGQTDGRDDES
jgi:hypothetical protein